MKIRLLRSGTLIAWEGPGIYIWDYERNVRVRARSLEEAESRTAMKYRLDDLEALDGGSEGSRKLVHPGGALEQGGNGEQEIEGRLYLPEVQGGDGGPAADRATAQLHRLRV